jgi:hypothetical protein
VILLDSWIATQAFYLVAVVLSFLAGTFYPIVPINALMQALSGEARRSFDWSHTLVQFQVLAF